MSSSKKIEEAQFFLELLDVLDQRRQPLTRTGDTAKEASFLFAAVLNSFYSAVVIMRDEEGINVKPFTDDYPEVYARAEDGGERAKTVHIKHTDTAFSGYISPPGNAVNFRFKVTPRLIEEAHMTERVDFTFGPDHYMFIDLRNRMENVTEFCYEHFDKLKAFHASTRRST
ncbi:hypothetical protein J2T41_000598 [Pseudomonas citronellolis]|uniref:hypothetical protein n=1 Tax=Pseudomonas citronellolis TaxID=53408 RepID=UPI0020A1F350|nr:hypothetical protein [Pseudomonas citronellolis]MCP1641004.1 hypothetical protein [Pseudomonas citronellolis]MCP1663922.1 hypothetical protein [Pseudomonas citronellolis]MCP1697100.1 hypothetical protein [Pseudomonas citronellolis]MCP1701266.1 hypothetical protein [Pseudomonas citronellolis]MCP1795709.1 hypothetical protein [Pseudomonas citronellolis]